MDLLQARMRNQKLAASGLTTAPEVVGWLGAVQAQDYAAAKWGLGLRATDLTERVIDEAFDRGEILRTHVMRPTWHFVLPGDIRWLLALTAPQVHRIAAPRHRRLGLDAGTFRRSRRVLERALRDRTHLTRAEIAAAFARSGVPAAPLQVSHIMLHHELEALVCSGPRRGAQFTYALLEERVPLVKTRARDESLADLTRRYLQSHGPATLQDFGWWSGLSMKDVRAGVAMMKPIVEEIMVDGLTYVRLPDAAPRSDGLRADPSVLLLPVYDEYVIAYRDRTAIAHAGVDVFANSMVVDGRIRGSWRRTLTRGSVVLEAAPDSRMDASTRTALEAQVERYAQFTGLNVECTSASPGAKTRRATAGSRSRRPR